MSFRDLGLSGFYSADDDRLNRFYADRDGNRLAFLGSDNESATGWRDNHETFIAAKARAVTLHRALNTPRYWSRDGGR